MMINRKRKRIVKTTTANSSEEAFVESGDPSPKLKKPEPKKDLKKKDEKPVVKKLRRKEDEVVEEIPAPAEYVKPHSIPGRNLSISVDAEHPKKQKKERVQMPIRMATPTRLTTMKKTGLLLNKIAREMETHSKKFIRNDATKHLILNLTV